MISRLRGRLIDKQPPLLFVEVAHAFTYEVHASIPTCYKLPELGEEVVLYTQFIVREEGHYLYGFHDAQERLLFNQLLKINGVGPKVALGILSKIETRELIACVKQRDILTLQRIPGIGKKTAERLVMEMSDRLPALLPETEQAMGETGLVSSQQQDAIAALLTLGYRHQEARRSVLQIRDNTLSAEGLIRAALKTIGR